MDRPSRQRSEPGLPQYKTKAENPDNTGVRREWQLLNSELKSDPQLSRYILVLLEGAMENSVPALLHKAPLIDMSDQALFDVQYNRLLALLTS